MKDKVVLLAGLLACVVHPAFGQTQLIVNGGFETGVPAPWVIAGSGDQISQSGAPPSGIVAFDGSYYLSMGNFNLANQAVYQTITFPTNLIAATLSFYYDVVSTDTSGIDTLSVSITDTNLNPLAFVGSTDNLAPTSGYVLAFTNLVSYTGQTNLSSYAGQTVNIYFSVTTASTSGILTTFGIDDVSMLIGTTADIPVNDNFTNRTALAGTSLAITATNAFATKEAGEPNHASNAGGHSLWWTWTSPGIGTVKLNTAGSSFTTLLGVYTGSSVSNLTAVASNIGNGRAGGTAQVAFNVTTGTQYQIAVDGFNGASGVIDLSLNFSLDTTAPMVSISSPAPGADLTNSTVIVHGTASDNVNVAAVEYRLENAGGTNAYQFANGTNTWSATLTNLIPGSNTVRVFAIDTSGNPSLMVARTFAYAVLTPLTVTTNGNGTVSPNYNGARLQIGKSYAMTAKAAPGFGFTGWTGSLPTTNATLKFVMVSNLTFTASFVDVTRPTLSITAPTTGQRWSNAVFTATGKAGDNVGVTSVLYQLNGGVWTMANPANNWTNWTAPGLALTPGTNVIRAYAVDTTGNVSLTNTVKFVYVLTAPLVVQTNGSGTVTPNLNGQFLQLGRNFSMTAKAAPGFAFTNWTGSLATTNATLKFVMASNLTFRANFVDVARPALSITAPTAGQRWSNAVFTATGKADDNVGVTSVLYQLNGGVWTMANPANNWTNWTAPGLALTPGTNVIRAYAVDTTGNVSLTNTVKFVYVLTAPLVVQTNGSGTVTPDYNGQLLEIGRRYTLTAKAAIGSAFTNWTDGVGAVVANKPALTFVMQSNLTFTVNFTDVARPMNIISFPAVNQIVTNAPFSAAGKARDNVGVMSVWYQLNGAGWNPAATANAFTNWTAPGLTLMSGPNLIQAFALDAAGHASFTNNVKFSYRVVPVLDWAPDSLNGLLAQVTPANGPPVTAGFDISNFTQTGENGDTNSGDYAVGNYLYVKTGTNTAQLTLTNAAPPTQSTNGPTSVELIFTNHYSGTFSNAGGGDTGDISLSVAVNFEPISLAGRTISAIRSGSAKTRTVVLASNGTFTTTPANTGGSGSSTGTYTFARYSPVGGMLVLTFNGADTGAVAYMQVTFTSATAGGYFVTSYDTSGNPPNTDNGTFTLH